MTVKTDYSRFHIHDELTAPEGSVRILKSVQGAAGAVSKFIGVLAGAPAALRAYARMRHELRGGSLPQASRERIGARRRRAPRRPATRVAQHARTARAAGLGLDEITLARGFELRRPEGGRAARLPRGAARHRRRPPQHLAEEAREHDWTDEQLLEAVAHLAMNEFQSLIANAAGAAAGPDRLRRSSPPPPKRVPDRAALAASGRRASRRGPRPCTRSRARWRSPGSGPTWRRWRTGRGRSPWSGRSGPGSAGRTFESAGQRLVGDADRPPA